MNNHVTNFLLVIISTIVGLYLVEGGLTYLGLDQPRTPRAIAAANLNIEYDERSKLDVIKELIASGIDAKPSVGPQAFLRFYDEFLPLGGVSKTTTVSDNENGNHMIFLSDRYGFNNPDSEWDAENIQWFLTGDSYAEGLAVSPSETIAGQIRVMTNQSSLSVGKSGNGPILELAALEEYASALKPKIVLWLYYERNDLSRNIDEEEKDKFLLRYMEDGFTQNLINRQDEVDFRINQYISEMHQRERDHIAKVKEQEQSLAYKTRWVRFYTIKKVINSYLSDNVYQRMFTFDSINPLFIESLAKAKSVVNSWGGEMYFVYLPEYGRYNQEDISHDEFRKKAEVIDVVKNLELPVIDIHQDVFLKHTDPLELFPFRQVGHYTPDGYRKVTKAILLGVKEYQ
jgi:hypothetical protein